MDKITKELYIDFTSLEISDFSKKYCHSKIYQFKKRLQENRSLPYTVIPPNTPVLKIKFKDGKIKKYKSLSTLTENLHYIKALNKSISYDSMLCASAWLLYNFYDVQMDAIQKDFVVAQSIKVAECKDCKFDVDDRKFMVNKNYDWPAMGIYDEKQKIALCRRMYNGELFRKYYDRSKSDSENIEYMIQMGMDISRMTYYRLKKDNTPKPTSDERLRIFGYYCNSRTKEEIMSMMGISRKTYYRLKKEFENRNDTFDTNKSLQNTENQYSYKDDVDTFDTTENRNDTFENQIAPKDAKNENRNDTFDTNKSLQNTENQYSYKDDVDTFDTASSDNTKVCQKYHLGNNIIINNIIREKSEEKNESSIPSDYKPIIEKENIKDESFKLFTKEKATTCVSGGGFSFSNDDEQQNAIQDSNETAIQSESSLPSDYKPIFDGIDDATKKQILLDNEKMKSDMESVKDNPAIQDNFLNVLDDIIKGW